MLCSVSSVYDDVTLKWQEFKYFWDHISGQKNNKKIGKLEIFFLNFKKIYSTIKTDVTWEGNHSVHPTHFLLGAGGGDEPRTKFSKRGSLTEPQLLEGVGGKEGGDFFQGGLQLLHKRQTKIWNNNINIFLCNS